MNTKLKKSIQSWRSRVVYPLVFVLILAVALGGYFTRLHFDKAVISGKSNAAREHASKQEPMKEKKQVLPLTAMAPPPPVVNVSAEEHPTQRLKRLNPAPAPQYARKAQLPKDLTARRQWTKPLALPAIPGEPPDPFTPPPIKVNPKRTPQPDVPRLSVGVRE
ncbi:hypothetical protein QUF72_09990 [Desulfobacterales bacterium HSG2]|nr:hypothetical protein [Desulfobacterales bacterium HSG2]